MIQSSIMDFSRAEDGADSACLQGAHSLTGRPAGGTTPPKAIPCKDSLPMGMTETQQGAMDSLMGGDGSPPAATGDTGELGRSGPARRWHSKRREQHG